MSRLSEWVARGAVVTDGAWGTEMQKLGLQAGECSDPWNLMHPDRVESVARAYCEAGSQVILTNTFRSNAISLAGADVAAVNRAGVEISRRAADGKVRVVASMGPSGKMLMTGEVDEATLAGAFRAQAQALADGGADALLLETFSDVEEARIAVRAAKLTGLPVIASFVFDSGKKKDRTMMGQTPEQVAAAMVEEGVDAVGANCSLGIEGFLPICARMRAVCSLPLWMKPNAGLPSVEAGEVRYATTAEMFASRVPELVQAGANFVGGCCGSSPEFIRAIRACVTS